MKEAERRGINSVSKLRWCLVSNAMPNIMGLCLCIGPATNNKFLDSQSVYSKVGLACLTPSQWFEFKSFWKWIKSFFVIDREIWIWIRSYLQSASKVWTGHHTFKCYHILKNRNENTWGFIPHSTFFFLFFFLKKMFLNQLEFRKGLHL